MKHKLLYIFFATFITFTSTGFGFLESSTAVHRRNIQSIKADSVGFNTINISLRNSSIPQKEIQKPVNESVTKSIMQWIAHRVKNTVEKMITHVAKIIQSIVVDLINFLTN